MTLCPERLKAVVFDYGNTIIPFGRPEIARLDAALTRGLARHYPTPDEARVAAIRDRNRMAPYAGDPPAYRENDLRDITMAMVRELYGRDPSEAELDHLLRVRHEAFLDVIDTPGYARGVLERLAARRPLALLSNYPNGAAIREGLERGGLADLFACVVVSGDLGYCKPHPITFTTVLDQLGVAPSEAVYVGDNWLADVQGAKRAGMAMIHTTQFAPAEPFAPQPGDLEPDAVIGHLREIAALLDS
ncbi:MAG TPA: HAD family hydrolase [Candidatus Hydrogenedentes bacterium]|nr:HAD family hydrolase [Candidatus Hydrogenedentota bacterium]HNT86247.1 HAD family hydrolase [Candidatus Hydrogenedentota bacterium]